MATNEHAPASAPAAMIEALAAPGPAPEHAAKLDLFGRLVGAWDVEYAHLDAAGAVTARRRGE